MPIRHRAASTGIVLTATLLGSACQPTERATALATDALRLDSLPSPAAPGSAEPFLSAAPDGDVMMSWIERDSASRSAAVRTARLDSARRWTTPSTVVRDTTLFVNWADFPSVVTLADGSLLAHWLQKNGSGTYAYDVRLAHSRDGGTTWSPSVLPHEAGVQAEHGFVTLLPRADSSADVLFLNGSPAPASTGGGHEMAGPPMRLAFARWTPGSPPSSTPAFLDQRVCDCCQTAAAMTASGPVILYRDRSESETRDISTARLVNGVWTPSRPLNQDGWVIDGCPVNGPAISARGERVAAVWFTAARDTAKAQLKFSTDNGATFGAAVRIDDGTPVGRVDVEWLDDSTVVTSWIERRGAKDADVRARIIHADGRRGPALTLQALAGGRASGFPRMAASHNGIVMAWTVPGPTSTIRMARVQRAK
jgi:hypothetical protein